MGTFGGLLWLVLIAAFVWLTVSARRYRKDRLRAHASSGLATGVAPVSGDLVTASHELLGLERDKGVAAHTTLVRGPTDTVIAVTSIGPRLVPVKELYAVVELPRSVGASLSFAAWRPTWASKTAEGASRALRLPMGKRIDDPRLERIWAAWALPASDASGALDADPVVWSVVGALSPAVATSRPAAAGERRIPGPDTPPDGLSLGPDVAVSFIGRFAVVGAGQRPTLTRTVSHDTIVATADFVVRCFGHLDR